MNPLTGTEQSDAASSVARYDPDAAPGRRLRAASGFPASLLREVDPARGARTLCAAFPAETANGGVALCWTPLRCAEGDFAVLRRVSRAESGLRIDARAIPVAALDDAWPIALARAPMLLEDSGLAGRASLDAAARDLAARLWAGLADAGWRSGVDAEACADPAEFWRAVAAFSQALPAALRPSLSVSAGFAAALPGVLLQLAPLGAPLADADGPAAALDDDPEAAAHLAEQCWRADAIEAATALRDWLHPPSARPDQAALEAFLGDPGAPQPPRPETAHEARAHLDVVLGVAETGMLGRRIAAPFTLARAAGLLALAGEDCFADAWRALCEAQPARAAWSALVLVDPPWLDAPIDGLDALARLRRFEAPIRALLDDGAPTPFDAPAYRRRVAERADRIGVLLTLAPKRLSEIADAAPLRDSLAGLSGAPRIAAAAALDAIAAAARRQAAAPLEDAANAWRVAASFEQDEKALADRARDAARRWLAAEEAEARDGAAFWRSAVERYAAEAEAPSAAWRAIFDAWLDSSDAAAAAVEPLCGVDSDIADAASEWSLGERLAARLRESAEDAEQAARVAARGVAVFATLSREASPSARAALRAGSAPFLGEIDSQLAVDPALKGAAPLAPAYLEAGFAIADLLLTWSAPPKPAPFLPLIPADGAPRGGVAALLARIFGSALARYLGRLDAPDGAPLAPDDGIGWRAFLKRRAIAANRALAQNAVAFWRGHYEALIARRADGGSAADADLSPQPQPAADAAAIRAVADLAEREPGRLELWLGEAAAWTVRQLIGMETDLKDEERRERLSFHPAPAEIRAAWTMLVNLSRRADIDAPELFFLFLATKLLHRPTDDAGQANPLAAPFLSFLREKRHLMRTAGGRTPEPTRGKLRAYVYLGDLAPSAEAAAALSEADLETRVERALLFNALIYNRADMPNSPALLWAPLPVSEAEAARLEPPESIRGPLIDFLRRDNGVARAFLSVLDRHLMFMLEDWRAIETAVKQRRD